MLAASEFVVEIKSLGKGPFDYPCGFTVVFSKSLAVWPSGNFRLLLFPEAVHTAGPLVFFQLPLILIPFAPGSWGLFASSRKFSVWNSDSSPLLLHSKCWPWRKWLKWVTNYFIYSAKYFPNSQIILMYKYSNTHRCKSFECYIAIL